MRKSLLQLFLGAFFFLFYVPNNGHAFPKNDIVFPGKVSVSQENEYLDTKKSLSAFPILMYDSDIGIGYGGKAKFVNYLKRKESFDLIVFNSSKGERWYVFTFSIPDIEIRQGKRYSFSFDLRAEYDKYLKYYFYGIGPDSEKDNETEFTYEKKELQLRFGRGFTPCFVLEACYILRNIKYFKVDEDRPFSETLGEIGEQFSPFISFVVRYDTSDSQIHPKKGHRLIFQNDVASSFLGNKNARFYRFTLDFRKFILLLGKKDVLAFRTLIQKISGKSEKIPLFEYSVLGGGSEITAMRGFSLNRFQDKGKFLVNAEYRFPLWRKLGGNVFMDGGLVWTSLSEIRLNKAVVDIGLGLRYYLQNFVVRFDMGFSNEGIGIYFNFGHIF
ncbi:MAG: BamA/TamA family outer membrane protein [Candidatus Aminicenantes bacterium]|nr:BamA/TamA family outer membrane protein [Candidatus Aminicenantes bacterium]